MIKDLISKSRSFRRFYEDVPVSEELLTSLIDIARLTPSARNAQPLKYILVTEESLKEKLFPYLAWAGYLTDWKGPEKGERPSAYIVVLGDTSIGKNFDIDLGISCQSILLGAADAGFGGCMVGAFNRDKVKELLEVPENMEALLVLALGKPNENVVIEDMENGDIKYWRDSEDVHHVPKRSLEEVIIKKL